jgi:hypothetical protein
MPEPTLQATALRYAAGDLSPDEAAVFETRLAEDQDARDALAEAVRLSAAAIGQKPPAPHPSFREAIRARLGLMTHRGHPFAWAGAGAAAVAVCTLLGLALADHTSAPEAATVTHAFPTLTEPISAPRAVEPSAPATAPMTRDGGVHVAVELHPTTGARGGEPPRSVAEIWADLSTPEHLEKVRDDELRWRLHMRNLAHPHHVSATAKAAGMTDTPQP